MNFRRKLVFVLNFSVETEQLEVSLIFYKQSANLLRQMNLFNFTY